MRRRKFITLLGSAAAAWPLAAQAQQPARARRIGFVSGGLFIPSLFSGFSDGMRDLGYAEGKDWVMEWRGAEGNYDRFRDIAADLVRLKVDVIVLALPAAVRPMQQATSSIPIVMGYSNDPVGSGFVSSLANPSGNVTGLAGSADRSAPKQLEWLTAIVPNLSRFGVLANPNNAIGAAPVLAKIQTTAQRLGLAMIPVAARNTEEIPAAFSALARERAQAVLGIGDPVLFSERQLVAKLAIANHLPSMFAQREYVEAGVLMSYGQNLREFLYRAAYFVDKIFRGAKPADLPVEQPTRFHLVINLKTAKALGLAVPPELLALADEVIE